MEWAFSALGVIVFVIIVIYSINAVKRKSYGASKTEKPNVGINIENDEKLLKAAEAGDAEAQLKLAKTYEFKDSGKYIYWLEKAAERGCDEAVLHRGSRVTECAHSNISILKDGVLRTAPTDELILPGITRKHLLALAREHAIPVQEEPFSMVELMNADEAIVTSSSALCMRVESIDHIPVGGRDPQRIQLLQDAYLAKFQRETSK